MAVTPMAILFTAIFAALLGALLVPLRPARGLLAIAGAAGLWYGWKAHGPMAAALPFLLLVIGGAQALGGVLANRRARLSDDEERMRAGPLSGLDRGDARRFLDQGMWMHGKAGDTLTREGDQVAHLYWLATGEAEVVAHGRTVGRIEPGSLVGEATILSPEPATATVRLVGDSTFWCAPAKALSAFLVAHPHTRHALEHGFTLSLKDKLDAMNRLRP